MSTDAESAPATQPSAAPAHSAVPKKKKKGAKKKLSRPLTEPEINVPDMPTLIMLGVLAATAIVLWVFAHAGCNYHPPRETRRPRDVTTAELTREPKDAGIEFQQRLLTQNYKGALEIAAGPEVAAVKEQQASCDANRAACEAKKKALSDVVTTAATVLERGPSNAKLRVTSYHLPGGDRAFLVLVERDANGWKVTAQVPDAPGATLPAPVLPQAAPIHFNFAPGANGQPQLVPAQPLSSPAAPNAAPAH